MLRVSPSSPYMVFTSDSVDFIGDVHGQINKLKSLLAALGYRADDGIFRAPEGVKAVFLGDLIDPKPSHPCPGGVRECLRLVKDMCDAGEALCLLGNHELNALHFHSSGPDGEPLRSHKESNVRTHQGTLDDFGDHLDPEGEWRSVWLPWFRQRPLFFDNGKVRAIHACWHPGFLAAIDGRSLEDGAFLVATANPSTVEGEAIEALLKGIELPIPCDASFTDQTGIERFHFRVRWWDSAPDGITCSDLVFPSDPRLPDAPMAPTDLDSLCPYPASEPPVFFGHYLKPPAQGIAAEAPNVACLDYSAAKDGPLVAYRWRGESVLEERHFVAGS